jgi:hypothetical protein
MLSDAPSKRWIASLQYNYLFLLGRMLPRYRIKDNRLGLIYVPTGSAYILFLTPIVSGRTRVRFFKCGIQ